ncbi:MAG TPA: aldolase/citrate lyase family protein, partial [Casimicrobiaceae bacterium]|nr:aldolase/citrate lyase family protein [Casimicrobiaceae bacterium]
MLRSYLFVPANRPDRYDKALASRAGAVIVDLEDAVAPADKQAARTELLAWLAPAKPVIVRINAPATEWFEDDLDVCSQPGVTAVVVPKAETGEQIARVAGA